MRMKRKQSNSYIWFFLILILAGAGYYYFFKDKKVVEAPVQTPATSTPTKTIDKPAGMPEGAQAEFGEEAAFAPEPTKTPVPKILTIEGTYTYSEDPKSSQIGKVCFIPNQTTSTIGKLVCFDNQDEVFAVLGIQKSFSDSNKSCSLSVPATIEVKNYTRLTGDVDGYDSATLIKVNSQGKQTTLPCK